MSGGLSKSKLGVASNSNHNVPATNPPLITKEKTKRKTPQVIPPSSILPIEALLPKVTVPNIPRILRNNRTRQIMRVVNIIVHTYTNIGHGRSESDFTHGMTSASPSTGYGSTYGINMLLSRDIALLILLPRREG